MIVVRRIASVVALPIILFVLWWVLSANSENFFLPPLSEILGVFPEVWLQGRMVEVVLPSLLRLTVGYLSAVALGVVLGVAIGSFKRLRYLMEPVLEFLRAIPPPVLVPVLILILGIDNEMKVAVIILGSVWPVLLNTIEGVRSVDEVLRDTSRSFGFRWHTRVVKLLIRGASPQIMVGARLALAAAIILTIISEMFAASSGIGFTIVGFQREYKIAEMWTGIILLGIIGVVYSLLFSLVERRVLSWYYGQRVIQRGGN